MTDRPASERHVSVLLEEVIQALAPRSGGFYIDATLGLGGHAEAILEASKPNGRLLGVDRDERALRVAKERLRQFGDRVSFLRGNFSEIEKNATEQADGLVADLGVSSIQLDEPDRGFSFSHKGPIDMRMADSGETALDLIEAASTSELSKILHDLGDVSHANRVARAIHDSLRAGNLQTTKDLADVVARVSEKNTKTHPATRVFMALRIAVNRELFELESLLESLPRVLKPGGRAAIISFHSLEDRRVKHATRGEQAPEGMPRGLPVEFRAAPLEEIGKPVSPTDAEIERNPRSRSARMRVLGRRSLA